jgi:hypothetical protein
VPDIATIQDVADELAARGGFRVEIVPVNPPNVLANGVNVFADRLDRYPVTTVWAPIPNMPGDYWQWGGNFEFSAERTATATAVAVRVIETLAKS